MLLDKQIIKLSNIDVYVRVSLKARNITIRIISSNHVELVIPKNANFNVAHKFLIEKELWIKNKLGRIKISTPALMDTKKNISILGQDYELVLGDKNITQPIQILADKLLVSYSIPEVKINLIIIPFLKKMIKIEIEKYAFLKAQELNVKFKNIAIRDTVSRWGSCSSNGSLSFSWRLVLAPRYAMEYVVVHELCHLLEMNHSHRFWKLVDVNFPEHTKARYWLKKNGKSLHSIFKEF
jgi:predicted metal-dependent hydrolase